MNAPATTIERAAKERPILFSGPLVRAILDGRKTQTRRVVKPMAVPCVGRPDGPCPYGEPGDRLWVRETFGIFDRGSFGGRDGYAIAWRATHPEPSDGVEWVDGPEDWTGERWPADERWRPSIHMPRWASRITLTVTDVRVERLQAITEEDARAEGVEPTTVSTEDGPVIVDARDKFSMLWDEINGERASWASNPWVWVVSFRREEPHR